MYVVVHRWVFYLEETTTMVMKHFICALEGCNNEFDRNISPSTLGNKRYCCEEHRDLANRKVNEYILHDDYAEMVIESKKYGKIFVKIDIEDVEKCKKHNWHVTYSPSVGDFYFLSRCRDNHKHIISLQRYIMDAPERMVVDHINTYDHRDNRKSNLRIVTVKENNQNQKIYHTNKSGVSGVSWHKQMQGWQVDIRKDGKHNYRGVYKDLEKAKEIAFALREELFGKEKTDDRNLQPQV